MSLWAAMPTRPSCANSELRAMVQGWGESIGRQTRTARSMWALLLFPLISPVALAISLVHVQGSYRAYMTSSLTPVRRS